MEAGIVPIREKFLRPNYLGALECKEGWIFFRVIRRSLCRYKPYRLTDSYGNPVIIMPNSYHSEVTFPDPRNPKNEVLYLETAKDNNGIPWILHGAIGIKPEAINMYLRVPTGQSIPGRFPNLDPIRPNKGDDLGYLSSEESPYGEPSDFVELVIPPRTKIGAEYFNKSLDRAYQPVLDLYFAVYRLQLLDPRKDSRLVYEIASRKVPAAFLTAGTGSTVLELGDMTISDWGVEPISLEEAAEERGGMR